MNKCQIRNYKSHFGTRWSEFKYNRKNQNKILLLENKFILSNLLPGSALALDCLGEVYQGIVNLDTVETHPRYNNILLINNIAFKYITPNDIVAMLEDYSHRADRLIVNFNSVFVKYDRLNQTIDSMTQLIEQSLMSVKLTVTKKFVTSHIRNYGFGNVFLVVDHL